MEVRIIKGTNQIGGCVTEIISKESKVLIDFGSDLDETKELTQIDGLTYGKSKYDAVFITHSHSDHIGLIDRINKDIPIYIDEDTFKIYAITCDFCGMKKINRKVNTFKLKNKSNKITIGDTSITPYRVDHSAYNSCMYLIESEGKRILHTGDYRFHGRKGNETIENLKSIGSVDLLITEGTTLSRDINVYKSEKELENEVSKYIKEYDQLFIMQSSTNIDRTVSFVRSTLKNNKRFILDLFTYSLNKVINMNINVDFKNIFVWIPYKYLGKNKSFKDKYMNFETSSSFGRNYVMEIKVSMLDDIVRLYKKGLITNACLIYSMWDGYIEKDEKIKEFIKECEKMNIKTVNVHTSGHADISSMKKLNEIVNPNNTIIIHTENRKKGENIFNNVIDLNDNQVFKL